MSPETGRTESRTDKPNIPSTIGTTRGSHQPPEVGKRMDIWVGFRGQDRFPATPVLEITEVAADRTRPGVLRLAGVELPQSEPHMAWGEGTVVSGMVHPQRGVIGFTAIGGVEMDPAVDEFFFLPPHDQQT